MSVLSMRVQFSGVGKEGGGGSSSAERALGFNPLYNLH